MEISKSLPVTDRKAWRRWQQKNYRRIRMAHIDPARQRPSEFKKRLENSLKLIAQGKQFSYGIESFYS